MKNKQELPDKKVLEDKSKIKKEKVNKEKKNDKNLKDINDKIIEEVIEEDSSYTSMLSYNALKEGFFAVKKDYETEMSKNYSDLEFEDVFISKLETYFLLSSQNDVVCQDFICYLYKIGVKDILPANYDKYFKWGMLAISNGNKFTIDRFRFFFNYMFNLIESNDNILESFEKFLDKEVIDEVYLYPETAMLIADEFCRIKNITIDNLLKEGFVTESVDEEKYRREIEKMGLTVLQNLIKRINDFNVDKKEELKEQIDND